MSEQKQVIKNLSNEEYHRGEQYRSYLSSTQLKQYAEGAKAALFYRQHPELNEETPSMKIGTYLHNIMENVVNGKTLDEAIVDNYAIFLPIYDESGKLLDARTKRYKEMYEAFLKDVGDKTVLSDKEYSVLSPMAMELCNNSIVNQLIGFAQRGGDTGAEVSMFYENEDGIKMKCRADMLTSKKIVDWKTTSCKLTPDEVVKTIVNFGYAISAAYYQYIAYKVTGNFYDFIWCFVQNKAPFGTMVVSASEFAFRDADDIEMYENDKDCQMIFNYGVMAMRSLLNEHIWSIQNNMFGGPESFVEPNEGSVRILVPTPPSWAMNQIPKFYH